MTLNKKINICQLIDSSDPGGAEKVALLYFDLLSQDFGSFLCVTRKDGTLTKDLKDNSNYYFLNRNQNNIIKTIFLFRKFVANNNINIIQSHNNSIVLATIISFLPPFPKLIWHGHFSPTNGLPLLKALKLVKNKIARIFCVNQQLRDWTIRALHFSPEKTIYIPNFSVLKDETNTEDLKLIGSSDKRIVCLANIHELKDHENLIRAFDLLHRQSLAYNDYVLILAGTLKEEDAYYQSLLKLIKERNLEKHIQFTGSISNVKMLLNNAFIAVLSSKTEGFPLSIIEYGLAGLPVVACNVGQIAEILDNGNAGILVEPQNSSSLSSGLLALIEDKTKQELLAKNLQNRVRELYSADAVYNTLKKVYSSL
jgi:glycosyltransferase involved in cell wall biosynthesis